MPALVLLGGMPMRRAVATSLLVISMQFFAGFVGHLGHVTIPWHVVLPVTALATVGSVAGGMLVKKVRPDSLRRGLAWLVMLVAQPSRRENARMLAFFVRVALPRQGRLRCLGCDPRAAHRSPLDRGALTPKRSPHG